MGSSAFSFTRGWARCSRDRRKSAWRRWAASSRPNFGRNRPPLGMRCSNATTAPIRAWSFSCFVRMACKSRELSWSFRPKFVVGFRGCACRLPLRWEGSPRRGPGGSVENGQSRLGSKSSNPPVGHIRNSWCARKARSVIGLASGWQEKARRGSENSRRFYLRLPAR